VVVVVRVVTVVAPLTAAAVPETGAGDVATCEDSPRSAELDAETEEPDLNKPVLAGLELVAIAEREPD